MGQDPRGGKGGQEAGVGTGADRAHAAGSIQHERLATTQILMTKRTAPVLRVRLLPQRHFEWSPAAGRDHSNTMIQGRSTWLEVNPQPLAQTCK